MYINKETCIHIHKVRCNLIFDLGQSSPTIVLQPSGFSFVGQRLDVICSISVNSDVDPDSIDLAWFNGEDIVTVDGRVTIVESTNDSTNITFNSNSSVITTVIQFVPLFEDDEGTYSCYSMVNESVKFRSVQLQNFRSKLFVMYLHSKPVAK